MILRGTMYSLKALVSLYDDNYQDQDESKHVDDDKKDDGCDEHGLESYHVDNVGDFESYHVLAEGVGVIVDHLQQLLHGSVEGGNHFPEEEKFH